MLTIKRLVPRLAVPLATLAAIGIGVAVTLGARHTPTVERIDFGRTARATAPVYDAALAPVSPAQVKEFRIPIEDTTIHIADGTTYQAWTFGGTVPGPILRARVGDKVHVTVVNETRMPHSIDFHAARIPPNIAYREIMPHDSVSFTFTPTDPGAFLVHCGTPPMLMHMMQGMYFAMIVDPRDGWGTKADREFVLVQSEFYTKDASAAPDYKDAMEKEPSYVVFNGRAFQYKAHPLTVKVGDRVRFFVVNAGPNLNSDFHIVGAIFNRVYPDGDPAHALHGVQTYMVPAGGGAVFETVFDPDASGAGTYAFVSHSFADAEKGAMGLIRVVEPAEVAATRR